MEVTSQGGKLENKKCSAENDVKQEHKKFSAENDVKQEVLYRK